MEILDNPNKRKCTCKCSEHLKLSLDNLVKTREALSKCLSGIRKLEECAKQIPKLKAVIKVQHQLINELVVLSDNHIFGQVPDKSIVVSNILSAPNITTHPTKRCHRKIDGK